MSNHEIPSRGANPSDNEGMIWPIVSRTFSSPVVSRGDWEEAGHDPKAAAFFEAALEDGESFEKTEWGYGLVPNPSLLHKGIALVRDMGKVAFSGQLRAAMTELLKHPFGS